MNHKHGRECDLLQKVCSGKFLIRSVSHNNNEKTNRIQTANRRSSHR